MSPYHQTKINIPKGKDHDDCWGSRHGWLAFSKGERIYLLNPLTEARLHLPPLGETPEKTWVFKAAGGDEDSLLVASVGRNLGLAFLRPGDREWTHVEKLQNGYKIEDVTLCNGKLFAFRCFDLGPMVMEFESTLGSLEDLYIDIRFEGYSEEGELTQFYLVESGGDLLMVVRLWEWDFCINFEVAEYEGGMDPKTVGFSVYKLDFRMGVWTRLRDLGGIALFVGEKCSFSMAVASNVVVVKPNRIYFAGDRRSFHSPDEVEAAMNDCGIFNMRDSTMEPLFQDDKEFSLFVASSVWFMPSL